MPKNSVHNRLLFQSLFYVSALGLWQVLAFAGLLPEKLLPAPSRILGTLAFNAGLKSFWMAIGSSLMRIAAGYSISVAAGLAMGFALYRFRALQETLSSLFLALQAFPSICWVPVALLWFGVNDAAVIFVVVFGSVFAIAVATNQAIRNVPPIYLRAAATMGSRGWHLYREIIFPAAVPNILYGLKLGWSYAWRTLIGSEIIIAGFGLGRLFQEGQKAGDMSLVFAVNVIVLAVSLLVDFGVFGRIEREIRHRWGLEGSG
ncbi:MAG: hypothetical protein A2902_05760 [Elusimicrobia bacterium RIFCSPLOWO2_01_FULL_64_13]|nr:MAG: hypothetical protein A2636_00450 [Elusimicrobia bacterium RIFCSPHIGHO2_01_FULL_64_10]OGR94256.1 MAG: hypothetical protein A2902_05760 [Elusimicrobia bacterium RIFCSPLOWO2_01_FULL_64_13]